MYIDRIHWQCLWVRNLRHELWELSVVDCGKHVHCRKSPQLEDQHRDLGKWLLADWDLTGGLFSH